MKYEWLRDCGCLCGPHENLRPNLFVQHYIYSCWVPPLKRKGERESHCLSSLCEEKKPWGIPLMRTENFTEETQNLIQLIHLRLNPICLNRFSKNPQLTWSNAISMSSLQRIPDFPNFILESKHSLAINAKFVMFLLLKKTISEALTRLEALF